MPEIKFYRDKVFLLCCFAVLLAMLVTRLPFYFHYSGMIVSSDTASYIAVVLNILNSKTPIFDIRTPGYPFFIYMIWTFSKSAIVIQLAQSVFTFMSAIFFLLIVRSIYRKYLIWFAIAIAGYISSSIFLMLEVSILTESIFVNFLIINFAFLILALKKNKNYAWIFYSITLALIILIRPAGVFAIPVIFFLTLYFFVSKAEFSKYVSALAPFAVIIFTLCTYNYATLNSFTISPFGESNLAGATVMFMEPSEKYPVYVNKAIDSTLVKISTKDRSFVKNNFDLNKTSILFADNFYKQLFLVGNLLKSDTSLKFIDTQPILRQISFDAIRNHPGIYLKFFLGNLYKFFINIKYSLGFFSALEVYYNKFYIEKHFASELESGRWMQVSSQNNDAVRQAVAEFYRSEIDNRENHSYLEIQEDKLKLKSSFLKSVYEYFEVAYDFIFRNILWMFLFILTFCLSFARLVKSKLKDTDAIIFFLAGVMFMTKAVLVSLVEISLLRYSYTIEFVYYFSLPFLIILINNSYGKKNSNTVLASADR